MRVRDCVDCATEPGAVAVARHTVRVGRMPHATHMPPAFPLLHNSPSFHSSKPACLPPSLPCVPRSRALLLATPFVRRPHRAAQEPCAAATKPNHRTSARSKNHRGCCSTMEHPTTGVCGHSTQKTKMKVLMNRVAQKSESSRVSAVPAVAHRASPSCEHQRLHSSLAAASFSRDGARGLSCCAHHAAPTWTNHSCRPLPLRLTYKHSHWLLLTCILGPIATSAQQALRFNAW